MEGGSHKRAYFGVSRAMGGVVKGREEAEFFLAEILSFISGDQIERGKRMNMCRR